MLRTPVAFLIFNRPALTARVFAAIAHQQPRQLLVVADGPRPDHPDDEELVLRARAVLDDIDWPCEVLTDYADANLGCGKRIASGLDWVFTQVPEAIILEDDCLPDPTFFRYCDELIDRYREDDQVHMVSGFNPLGQDPAGGCSYRFSRCFHIWGWATWARAWRYYDYTMRAWPAIRRTRWLERHVKSRNGARIARWLFDETYAGQIRQWDFQWVLSGWLRDSVSVVPRVNLVANLGYNDDGTHMRDPHHPFANLTTRPLAFPLSHPPELAVLESTDAAIWDLAARGEYEMLTAGPLRRWVRGEPRLRPALTRR